MRKILSVLLTLCMLMTCAPTAVITSFAEEDVEIPVIEEVSEEELVEIFEEGEVELYGDVALADIPEEEGYTLISGLDGASVSSTGTGLEGNTASLINGKYTTGTWGGADTPSNAVWYKDGNGVIEGFMGWTISGQTHHTGSSIAIDLGSEQTFSGLRIYDSVRARSINESTGGARKAKFVDISISADGKEWTVFDRVERTDFTDGVYDYLLKKTDDVNAKARYIKVRVDKDNSAWGQFEFEEIVLIDENTSLTTTVEPELYKDYYEQSSYFTYERAASTDVYGEDWGDGVGALFDGQWPVVGSTENWQNRSWHTNPRGAAGDVPASHRTVTITFDEEQKIGGFRIYPRVDNDGGTPAVVTIMASTDGTTFTPILERAATNYNGTTKLPVEVLIQTGEAYKALKFQVDKAGSSEVSYTCFCELQILKPKKGYAYDEDVVCFTTTPAITSAGATNGASAGGQTTVFDKTIYQFVNEEDGYYNPLISDKSSQDPNFGFDHAGLSEEGNTAWAVIDLGKEYTFSALRVFGRWNQVNQCIKEAVIYVSDDGTEWVELDNYSDDYTQTGKTFDESVGVYNNGANMAKYKSTGDVYTDVTTKLKDTAYNVKARYVKLEAIKTGGNHWHTQEILLVKPNEDNETKTVDELKELDAPEEVVEDYYTNAADWTWTAEAWTDGTPVTKLYDGIMYGDQGNCWHSPTGLTTPEDVPITIMFDKATEVGGVRLYPRTVNGGASPNVISVQGTYDGETWVDVVKSAKLGISWQKEAPGSANFAIGSNNTFLGLKVIINQNCNSGTKGHTCFTELEVLKPIEVKAPLGEDEVSMSYPAGTIKVYGVKDDVATERHAGKGYILCDGVYLTPELFTELGGTGSGFGGTYQLHNDHCIGSTTADSVYIIYDMGKTYEFSGLRLYQRVKADQNFKRGYISVSEDGENWITSDEVTVTPAIISALSEIKFGGNAYNMKARYVKIHCIASQSKHWALEEVRLLSPLTGIETKTPTEIVEDLAAYAEAVETLINAIGTVTLESKDAIDAARKAYDALPEALQEMVANYDTLEAAEADYVELLINAIGTVTLESKDAVDAARDAYDALPEAVKGEVSNYETLIAAEAVIAQTEAAAVEEIINAIGDDPELQAVSEARMAYDALSETAKALVAEAVREKLEVAEAKVAGLVFELPVSQNTGLKKATFTMPVRDDMTIKSVKYEDIFGNEIDGTDATTVSVDGTTMTVTMAGDYKANEGLTQFSDGTGTYYFATDNATYGWKAGDLIEPSFFKGLFVRRVAADKLGDHYITITFGDDTTAVVNLKTIPTWNTLTGATAIEGSEYTDEIAPKNTWKVTTTIRNTNLASAFDGKAEYLLNKGGSGGASRFETDFVAGHYSPNADLSGKKEQVLLYAPVRFDFIIDTGEITKISGFRIYPRVSSYNVDKTKGGSAGVPTSIVYWGSNDGIEWTNLGEYSYTTNLTEKTASFANNVSYRYYKGSVLKANGKEFTTANISEFALLAPSTRLLGGEINVDLSGTIEDQERKFNSDNKYAITSVVNKTTGATLTEGTDYVLDSTKAITVKADYLKSLAIGTYEIEVTVDSGETCIIKVNINDMSVVSYVLSGSAASGTENLVLTNATGKTVKGVALSDGTALKYTAEGETITVIRPYFRGAHDFYQHLAADDKKAYEQKVNVTFVDDSVKEYTVNITAEWVSVKTEMTTTFMEDEVATSTAWRVRTDSALIHPVNTFTNAAINIEHDQNYHADYTGVSGVGTLGDGKIHYIDVDMGDDIKEVGGIRYVSRFNSSDWVTVAIFGSDDYAEWTELYTGKHAGNAGTHTMLFSENSDFRYIRIRISDANYPTADTIHFLAPAVKVLSGREVKKDTSNTSEEVTLTLEDLGDEGIASVTFDGKALTSGQYTYDAAKDTLVIKAAAISGVKEDCDKILTIIAGNGKIGTVTIQFRDFSVRLFPEEALPYHFEQEIYFVDDYGFPNDSLDLVKDRSITVFAKGEDPKTSMNYEKSKGVLIYPEVSKTKAWNATSPLPVLEVDYKIPHEFSGVRLYHNILTDYPKDKDPYRYYFTAPREAYLEVSNDGISWLKSDKVELGKNTLQKDTNNNMAQYSDVKFTIDGIVYNVEARYLRIYVTKNGSNQPVGLEEICLYEASAGNPDAMPALLTQTEATFSLENQEDVVFDVDYNHAVALTDITILADGEETPLNPKYYYADEDSVNISKYYFIDGAYDEGTVFNMRLNFAIGESVLVKINVADAEEYKVTYSSGANGNLKAVVRSVNQAGKTVEEEVASGSMVAKHKNLVFVAKADSGYVAKNWTLKGEAAETVILTKVTDKKGWTYNANTGSGTAKNAFDGIISANNYWHSGYDAVYNPATGKNDLTIPHVDIKKESFYLTATFAKSMTIPELAITYRLNGFGGQRAKDYKVWGTCDGENFDELLAEGTLNVNATGTQTIKLKDEKPISGIKFEILSINGGGPHCTIAEITLTEKNVIKNELKGNVTYTGSASQEYEVEELFADVDVKVDFEKVESGTAKVTTNLKKITAEIEDTVLVFGENAVMTLSAADGETLPAKITVKMDGKELKVGQDYTYNATSGKVEIMNVQGDIEIAAVAAGIPVYTVTYTDIYGALGNIPEGGEYVEGEKVKIAACELVLSGHTFAGWKCSEDGKVYGTDAEYTMKTTNVTFEATWSANSASDDDEGTTSSGGSSGGSNRPSGSGAVGGGIGTGATTKYTVKRVGYTELKVAAGTVIEAPETKEGYDFLGWYLDEALSVPYANTGVIENVTLYPYFRRIRNASELADIANHWAKDAIGEMYVAYIVNGKGENTFDPNSNITRAEFCQILYMMSGQTSDGSEKFDDVNVGDWFTQAVAWAVNNGITLGTTETTFSPYANITREQMATMIYRYAILMGHDWTISKEADFADKADIAEYANYQVNWAADKGVINGYPDGTFGPKAQATRAEAVTMLQRLKSL